MSLVARCRKCQQAKIMRRQNLAVNQRLASRIVGKSDERAEDLGRVGTRPTEQRHNYGIVVFEANEDARDE